MLLNACSSKVFMIPPPSPGTIKASESDSMSALTSMHVHVVEREDVQPSNTAIEDWDIGRQSKVAEVIDLTED